MYTFEVEIVMGILFQIFHFKKFGSLRTFFHPPKIFTREYTHVKSVIFLLPSKFHIINQSRNKEIVIKE